MEVSLLESLSSAQFNVAKAGKGNKKTGFWARKKFTSILSASQLKAAKSAESAIKNPLENKAKAGKTALDQQTLLKGALALTADPENPGLKHSLKSRSGKSFPNAKQHLTDLVVSESQKSSSLEASLQDYLSKLEQAKKSDTKKTSNTKGSDVALQLLSIPVERKAEIQSFKASLEAMLKGDKGGTKKGLFNGRLDPETLQLSGSDMKKLKHLIDELGQIQSGKKVLKFSKDPKLAASGPHRFGRLSSGGEGSNPKKAGLKGRLQQAHAGQQLAGPEGEQVEVTKIATGKKTLKKVQGSMVTQVPNEQKKDAFKELWHAVLNPGSEKDGTQAAGRFMGRREEFVARSEVVISKPLKQKAQRVTRHDGGQQAGLKNATAKEATAKMAAARMDNASAIAKTEVGEGSFQEVMADSLDHLTQKSEAKVRKSEPQIRQSDAMEARKSSRVAETVASSKGEAAKPAPQPMFRQVQEGIRTAYIVRPKAVTVRLTPDDLGEVQVQVTQENDQIKAKIRTETQKVAAVLKDHQAELENRMRESGVEIDHIEIKEDKTEMDGKRESEQQTSAGQWAQQQHEQQARQGGEAGGANERQQTARKAEQESLERESDGSLTVEAAASQIQDGRRFSVQV